MRGLRALVTAAAAVLILGTGFLVTVAAPPAGAGDLRPLAKGEMANFIVFDPPRPVSPGEFRDGSGKARSLEDFRGKVVLLNLWATWCAPCREEMPSLDRLQQSLGGRDFEVVAVALDRGGADAAREFLAEVGVSHLALYVDPSMRSGRRAWAATGLPTTLLIDREGREVGRLIGGADWDSSEAKALIRQVVGPSRTARPTSAAVDPQRVGTGTWPR